MKKYLLILFLTSLPLLNGEDNKIFNPQTLLDEVAIKVSNDKPAQWDLNRFNFHLTYIQAQEKNLFSSEGVELSGSYKIQYGAIELGARYFSLQDTDVSKSVQVWPILQQALPSRFEGYVGYEFIAVQGRGRWFLTTLFGDLEHIISILGIVNGFYYYKDATTPALLQTKEKYDMGAEIGFRWKLLSNSGISLLSGYNVRKQMTVLPNFFYLFYIGVGYQL